MAPAPPQPVIPNPHAVFDKSRPVIPYTISKQDRDDWKRYREDEQKYRMHNITDFLKVLGSLQRDATGEPSVDICGNKISNVKNDCRVHHGFVKVNVTKAMSVHEQVQVKTKLPATWKEWGPVKEFLECIKTNTGNRLEAAWCELGNLNFDRPPALVEQRNDINFPYVNIACKGPPIYWTFAMESAVFSCKIRSRAGDATFNKESLIFVGKMIPVTLAGGQLRIGFGVVVQTAQKITRVAARGNAGGIYLDDDGGNPDKYINVVEMVLAPSRVAAVTVDWGLPSKSSLGDKLFVKLKTGTFELNSKPGVVYDDAAQTRMTEKYTAMQRIQAGNYLKHSQAISLYADTLHTVENDDIMACTLEVNAKVVCKFTWDAIKRSYEIQALKHLTYAMLAKVLGASSLTGFTSTSIREANESQAEVREMLTRNSGVEIKNFAMKYISVYLHLKLGMFPFSQGFGKCLNERQENAILSDLKALFMTLYEALGYPAQDYEAFFKVLTRAVADGYENPPAAHIALKNTIERMKFFKKDPLINPEHVLLLEYASPCAVSRTRIPLFMDPMSIVVNFGFLHDTNKALFDLVKAMLPYDQAYYKGPLMAVQDLNALTVDLQQRRSGMYDERNKILEAAKDEIPDNACYIRLEAEFTGRNVEVIMATQSKKPPNVTRTQLSHETNTRVVQAERTSDMGNTVVNNYMNNTYDYELGRIRREQFHEQHADDDVEVIDASGAAMPASSRSYRRETSVAANRQRGGVGIEHREHSAAADPTGSKKIFMEEWLDYRAAENVEPPSVEQLKQRLSSRDMTPGSFNTLFIDRVLKDLANDQLYVNLFEKRFNGAKHSDLEIKEMDARRNVIMYTHVLDYEVAFEDTPALMALFTQFKFNILAKQSWLDPDKTGLDVTNETLKKYFKNGLINVNYPFEITKDWSEQDWQPAGLYAKLQRIDAGSIQDAIMECFIRRLLVETGVRRHKEQLDARMPIRLAYRLYFLKETSDFAPVFVGGPYSTDGAYKEKMDNFSTNIGSVLHNLWSKHQTKFSERCATYDSQMLKPTGQFPNGLEVPLLPFINTADVWYDRMGNECLEPLKLLFTYADTMDMTKIVRYVIGNMLTLYLGGQDLNMYAHCFVDMRDVKSPAHGAKMTKVGFMYRTIIMQLHRFISEFKAANLSLDRATANASNFEAGLEAFHVTLREFYSALYNEFQDPATWMYGDPGNPYFFFSDNVWFYLPENNSVQDESKAEGILQMFVHFGGYDVDDPDVYQNYCVDTARRYISYSENEEYSREVRNVLYTYDTRSSEIDIIVAAVAKIKDMMRTALGHLAASLRTAQDQNLKSKQLLDAIKILTGTDEGWSPHSIESGSMDNANTDVAMSPGFSAAVPKPARGAPVPRQQRQKPGEVRQPGGDALPRLPPRGRIPDKAAP